MGTLQTTEGNFTNTEKETLEELLKVHFPGSSVIETKPGASKDVGSGYIHRPTKKDWEVASNIINYKKNKMGN